MNIHEYQGKSLLQAHGVAVQEGFVAETAGQAAMVAEELRKKFGMSPGYQNFVFISSGHSRKGLPLLIDAFRRLQNENVELFVAGDSGSASGLKNILFLGFVKDPEELYAAADFTIHPSVYEPYGQVVAESILCGTPVLISDKTAACEIVGANEGVVLNHLDPEKWAQEILDLKNKTFSISPAFGEEKEITLEHHMKKMLAFCGIRV